MSKIGNADLSKVYIGNTEVANIYIGNTMIYQNLIAIPYPVLSGSYTFNNSAQTPTFTNYDATTSDIGGTYSAMNAGSYTATFTPKRGYCWADKSVGAYSVSWNISPKDITGATITLNGSLIYNGGTQTQNISSVVIDGLTATYSVSDNTGTNAGNYTLICSGNGNFTGSQNKAWSIAKAAGLLTLSSYSGTVSGVSGTTLSITATRSGDGIITATSSNTSVATVSISGTSVIMTGISEGSATITVSVAEGTNHLSPANQTYSLTASIIPAGAIYYNGLVSGTYKTQVTDNTSGSWSSSDSGTYIEITGYNGHYYGSTFNVVFSMPVPSIAATKIRVEFEITNSRNNAGFYRTMLGIMPTYGIVDAVCIKSHMNKSSSVGSYIFECDLSGDWQGKYGFWDISCANGDGGTVRLKKLYVY